MPQPVLELLVATFRDLRGAPASSSEKNAGGSDAAMDRLTAVMSTAEAVNVAHAVGVRDLVPRAARGLAGRHGRLHRGHGAKDNADDRAKLRRYFEQKAAKRSGEHWRAYCEARHRLPWR